MDSIRQLFSSFLSQRSRLIELVTPLHDGALVVERFSGREAVSEPFRFVIDCVSDNAHLELHALMGEELTLRLRQADGTLRNWHGYVTEAMQLGADGGLARYRLVMGPWFALLAHRRDNYLFQDMDCLEVCEHVFADFPEANWRHDVTQALRRHSVLTQYGESDLDFVRRILADEGLAFRFEHDQAAIAGAPAAHARHLLVIFDREAERPDCLQPVVRYHRSHASESSDTIQILREARSIGPNRVARAGWDYTRLVATGAVAVASTPNGHLPDLEIFDGATHYAFESAEAAQLCSDLAMGAFESGYQRFTGEGSVRHLAEGCSFTLTQHEQYRGDKARFGVLAVEHHGANNLGTQAAKLLEATDIEAGSYRNRFTALAATRPMLPLRLPKPAARTQTALVVGLPEAPLTTERDHRIKIQFHWQRGCTPNPGGLGTHATGRTGNAPGNHQSGTWVRVAEWLAGPNWGSHFLPRVGTEVVVQFLDGDIDRPLITGQLYSGQDLPPFTAGDESTANHPGTVAGWMSHNFQDGLNQWFVDDAPGQLRTGLACSDLSSQLSLGHLIEHELETSIRGPWRGSGFELRTDGWVAVRAGEGILISATLQPHATDTQMAMTDAASQLRAARQTAEALSEAAVTQDALPLAANAQQGAFINTLDPQREGKYEGSIGNQDTRKAKPGSRAPGAPAERFSEPIIVSETPGDIGLSTPASTLLFAGQNLHLTSQADLHAAAHTLSAVSGAGTSLFSHTGGIQSIAAAGSHSIQAHADAMDILADQSVTVTSSNGEIRIHAKDRIVLQAGQSAVTLHGGDVTFACPGTFSVKGAGHAFEGPQRSPGVSIRLPSGKATPLTAPGPLQTVFSQTLATTALSHDWLPIPLDAPVTAQHDGETLETLSSVAGNDHFSTLFTAQALELRFWIGQGHWRTEEALLLADDDVEACDADTRTCNTPHDDLHVDADH